MNVIKAIRSAYTISAVITLTTVLLLSLVIAGLLLYESNKAVEISEVNPRVYNAMIARDIESLKKVYPGKKIEDIRTLLFETWTRPYLYEAFTQFRERPYAGKYVNVSPNGFREVANQKSWPPKEDNFNIFMFGGSTLFGYGVADEDTIASYLGEYLEGQSGAKEIAVYNFGAGFYYSTQERILYEQLIAEGYIPNLVIFIDGLNEFVNSSNHPYLTKKLRKFINRPVTKKRFTQVISDLKQKIVDTQKWLVKQSDLASIIVGSPRMKERVVENYLQNMRLISAVSREYDVSSLFVWQPVPTYKYDSRYHVFGGEGFGAQPASLFGYKHMKNVVAENPPTGNFLWLADMQKDIQRPLYVDKVHYTAEFSRLIAKEIAGYISEQGLIPTR